MKKFLLLIVSLLLQFVTAYTEGDSTWSVYVGKAIYKIYPSPDGKYLFCNQNRSSRFIKVDAITGQVIDSISGKGLIMAISPDWKYLYTCYSTFESIKKLDINTYQTIDSLDNMQDIQEIDSIHKVKYTLTDMKLTADNRIILSVGNGKYIFILLDASNLEILDKKLRSNYSRGLDFLGPNQISISPNGDYFVANYGFRGFDTLTNIGYNWNETWVWDYKMLKPVKQIFSDSAGGAEGNRYPLVEFNFSPDGNHFFMNRNNTMIYKTPEFNLIKQINRFGTAFLDISNSSDYFVVNVQGTVSYFADTLFYYKISDFSEVCSQKDISIGPMKFNPDNKFIYYINDETGYFTKSRTCIYPVGIMDTISIAGATIIFNPVSDELAIKDLNKADSEYEIRITDVSGNIIKIDNIVVLNHQFTINVVYLPPGVYFLTIDNQTFKFSIVR